MAACQEIGGDFHFALMFRSTSQISLLAASSLGKWPLPRTAFLTWLCRLSMAQSLDRHLKSHLVMGLDVLEMLNINNDTLFHK